jgi:hypothetical protein
VQIFQYEWMKKDMASVDRSKTPWLIFMGYVNLKYIYIGLQINVGALEDAIRVCMRVFGRMWHVHVYGSKVLPEN